MSVEDRARQHRRREAPRRRVRSTAGAPARPRRAVTIHVGAGKPRRRRRLSRRRGVLAATWAVIALLWLTAALVTQLVLYLVVAGLSLLVSLAAALLPDDDPGTSRPAPAAKPGARPRTGPPRRPARPPVPGAGQVVKCRQTGQPIDRCGCAPRHVATSAGAARYNRPVGSPIPRGGKQ